MHELDPGRARDDVLRVKTAIPPSVWDLTILLLLNPKVRSLEVICKPDDLVFTGALKARLVIIEVDPFYDVGHGSHRITPTFD